MNHSSRFAIWDCYPETSPYGGRYPDVVPHLTVANQLADDQLDGITAELNEASEGKLPIAAVASEIALLDTRSGRWQVRAMLKLGGSLRVSLGFPTRFRFRGRLG